MGKLFLAYLPPEIIIDILSRLPYRTIMRFRCVCKSWLSLFDTQEFIKSYFQKSSFPGGLALFLDETSSKPLRVLEFIDEEKSAHPCRAVLSISFPTPHPDLIIRSSVNGLLFLFNRNKDTPFICNPITREYIELPSRREVFYFDNYGFGMSKKTGQYKVVRMFRECHDSPFDCEVYTVGTRTWRSIAADVPLRYTCISFGVFLDGNLHWLALDSGLKILCFDLETERLSTFSTPLAGAFYDYFKSSLYALGDCLYFCQSFLTTIFLMNEYGDDKSWREEFVIKIQSKDKLYPSAEPIKIFKDGDI